MSMNLGDIIQPTAGGDIEVGGGVLRGFLWAFSFLRASGLTKKQETGGGEGGPAVAGIPVSREGSWL